ncbi:prolipoprotein diacylglyceryl transferase [archaeon]|nr:prolipoprotein diacylglyceryl transferase [archaeon]|tara:strand:- start:880 stop:1644 length:765 start_codon:yes stop_codon:yes gene_type:complete
MISPVAFYIGNVPVRWYGLMMFMGLILGYIFLKKLAKENNLNNIATMELYLFTVIGLFLGCRIFHVLVYNFQYFLSNPASIFYIWQGGLSSHGGIIGGTLSFYVFCKKNKLPFWKLADVAIIPIGLSAGFVRIGNFLNSEVIGRVTSVPWAIEFYGRNDLRHPSQLYEAAKNFFVCGLLYNIYSVKKMNLPDGTIYWLFIFLFSFLRFFTEFFKEYIIFNSGLTIGQYISIIFTIISGIMLFLIMSKKVNLSDV